MYAILHITFWIFVLLLALSFFGISIQMIIQSPVGQENFGYAWHLLITGWDWIVTFGRHYVYTQGI